MKKQPSSELLPLLHKSTLSGSGSDLSIFWKNPNEGIFIPKYKPEN